ncbi:MAG TPA: DUF4185 domain-containing protein [Labilithrix sp.]|nr:DUF4185 domain-containing protein [Labilithrix sp.]
MRLLVALSLVGFACAPPAADGRDSRPRSSAPDTTPDDDDDPSPSTNADGGKQPTGPQSDAGGDDGSSKPVSKPAATKKIRDLTGPGTSAKQFGVGGTDLGIPIRQPNGKIAYIFGDTWEQDTIGGPGWRSPVLLRSEPGNLDAGITFNGAAGGNYAKQLLDYQHNTADYSTWLPSDAITIDNRIYLHYMVNKGLGNVVWSQIAYSDDNGENWALSGARWEGPENGNLRQLWTWARGDDGYVYTLSTSFKRADPIILHRVPENQLLTKSAYEPWGYKDGKWAWGNPPTPVLDGKFGELCLRKVENKWVLSWFNAGDYDLTIKVFDSPTSNLFTAKTYKPIKGGAWGAENDTTVAQLYGGYIHPDSTLHNLHLIVSQWNTDTETGGFKKNWPYRAMQFITGVE